MSHYLNPLFNPEEAPDFLSLIIEDAVFWRAGALEISPHEHGAFILHVTGDKCSIVSHVTSPKAFKALERRLLVLSKLHLSPDATEGEIKYSGFLDGIFTFAVNAVLTDHGKKITITLNQEPRAPQTNAVLGKIADSGELKLVS